MLKDLGYSAAALLIYPKLVAAKSSSQNEISQQFSWRVPKVHFETVKNELTFQGNIEKEKDTKGAFVYIFIGAVLIPYLAKAVLALRREIVQGGIVIDTTGERINIDTDKSLPGSIIVVKSLNGTEIYEKDEIENPTELVNVLMKGL
jgi:hypothetical protein